MKKIAKQFALFVLVMFGLQASARTCAFMQVGGVIEEATLSKVVSTPKSTGHSTPQSDLPLGDSHLKSGSVSSPAQSSPGYTFKKATNVVSGRRYMIVAMSGDKFYAASMQKNNSSDLQSVEVVVNNDKISSTKNDLAFTFEGNDKGFVIWQSNGTYLTNTKEYTRIKWSEASNKSQGVWIVDDRGSYTNIQNIKSQRYFFFSDNRKIFLAYINKPTNINLYEEILTEVPVSVSSVGYATLYYEDRALKVPDGVTAITYAYNESAQSLVVSKTYEAGSVIPAGVAVVLKAQPGEYTFTVSDEAGEKPTSTNLYGYNVPSTTSVHGMSKYYMLSLNAKNDPNSVGFYWGDKNGTAFKSEAHKAFLALPESATAKSFTFADIADGITSVSRCSDDSDSPVYSLTGIRMSGKLPAGIYVRGGKKFIVR
ncbi:MAG: hypothetical protein ACOCOU_07065 [Prevotella sp.]